MSDSPYPPPPEAPKPKPQKMIRIWVTHCAVVDTPVPDDFDLGGWIQAVRSAGFFFSLDRKTYIRIEDIAMVARYEVSDNLHQRIDDAPAKEGKVLPFTLLPGGADGPNS